MTPIYQTFHEHTAIYKKKPIILIQLPFTVHKRPFTTIKQQ